MAAEFVALTSFGPPGSMIRGYNRGDRVDAHVVEAWGLVVGEGGQVMPLRTDAVPRPEGDDRAEWEAFALGRGWTQEDATAASLSDLKKIKDPEPDEHGNPAGPEPLPDPTAAPVRPEESAVKAEWVDYVTRSGGDPEWAEAKATTKADLMAWQPEPADAADPVAADATAQANG